MGSGKDMAVRKHRTRRVPTVWNCNEGIVGRGDLGDAVVHRCNIEALSPKEREENAQACQVA